MDFLSTDVLEAIRMAYEKECLKRQIELLDGFNYGAGYDWAIQLIEKRKELQQQLDQLNHQH